MPTHILDPKFKYVPAVDTDLRKKFKKLERELREQKKAEEALRNVRPLKRRTG